MKTQILNLEIYMVNFMDDWTLYNYCRSNKQLYKIYKSELLWKRRIQKYFGSRLSKNNIENNRNEWGHLKMIRKNIIQQWKWKIIYETIKIEYLYDLDIPINNVNKIYSSLVRFPNKNIYSPSQWTYEKFKISLFFSHIFYDIDIIMMINSNYLELIDQLPLNKYNTSILIDVYFIDNDYEKFKLCLNWNISPSYTVWSSLFKQKNKVKYSNINPVCIYKRKACKNILQYRKILSLCIKYGMCLLPRYFSYIDKYLNPDELLMLLDLGYIYPSKYIYKYICERKSYDTFRQFIKYLDHIHLSFLHNELSPVDIRYTLDLGLIPNVSFNKLLKGKLGSISDKKILEYLKIICEYNIIVPQYFIIELQNKGFIYSYNYMIDIINKKIDQNNIN
jgi:hypothetical protein